MMGYGRYGYGMMNYGMMGYGWGWIMMLGVCALVVLGIFVLIHYSKQQERTSIHSSLDILNERYARGEINHEEYVKMKALLSK